VRANAIVAQKAYDCKGHQSQNPSFLQKQHLRMSARMIRGLHQKQHDVHFLLNPKVKV
jgi:hypothetical protein